MPVYSELEVELDGARGREFRRRRAARSCAAASEVVVVPMDAPFVPTVPQRPYRVRRGCVNSHLRSTRPMSTPPTAAGRRRASGTIPRLMYAVIKVGGKQYKV